MSGILEDVQEQELVKDLADEITGLLAESNIAASTEIITTKHRIGKLITEHEAYKKGKHGQGGLIKQLATITGQSVTDLHDCIQFVERYPQVSNALETLAPDGKNLSWRQVVHKLHGGEAEQDCAHADVYIIKYSCCRDCGKKEKI